MIRFGGAEKLGAGSSEARKQKNKTKAADLNDHFMFFIKSP